MTDSLNRIVTNNLPFPGDEASIIEVASEYPLYYKNVYSYLLHEWALGRLFTLTYRQVRQSVEFHFGIKPH